MDLGYFPIMDSSCFINIGLFSDGIWNCICSDSEVGITYNYINTIIAVINLNGLKYMKNIDLITERIYGVLDEEKSAKISVSELSEFTEGLIKDGKLTHLEVKAAAKKLEYLAEKLNEVSESGAILTEANAHVEEFRRKTFEKFGVSFNVKEVSEKIDFSLSKAWKDITKKIKDLDDDRKDIEEDIKSSIKLNIGYTDSDGKLVNFEKKKTEKKLYVTVL